MEVRVENNLRTVSRGPSHRLRIAPTFVADRHSKRQRPTLEYPPAGTARISALLGWVNLYFVLETRNCSILIDDQRGNQQSAANDPFGAQNNRDIRFRSGRRNR